jgi:sugar phosphate isomerase/epimerase
MRQLSLGCVTLLDVPVLDLVSAAAAAGYHGVSVPTGAPMMPSDYGQVGFQHSLLNDSPLRRQIVSRAADAGLSLDLMEGFIVGESFDPEICARTLDVAVEMGVKEVSVSPADPNPQRFRDNLAILCALAVERQRDVSQEFWPLSHVSSFADCVRLIDEGRYPGLRISVDALHLARGGETPADVVKAPHLVGCCQICDGPKASPSTEAYRYESFFERAIPGEGELPVVDLLAALPQDCIIYVEVPKMSWQKQGLTPTERARRPLDAVRRLLAA